MSQTCQRIARIRLREVGGHGTEQGAQPRGVTAGKVTAQRAGVIVPEVEWLTLGIPDREELVEMYMEGANPFMERNNRTSWPRVS